MFRRLSQSDAKSLLVSCLRSAFLFLSRNNTLSFSISAFVSFCTSVILFSAFSRCSHTLYWHFLLLSHGVLISPLLNRMSIYFFHFNDIKIHSAVAATRLYIQTLHGNKKKRCDTRNPHLNTTASALFAPVVIGRALTRAPTKTCNLLAWACSLALFIGDLSKSGSKSELLKLPLSRGNY